VDEYEALLTRNGIWLKRTQGVGILKAEDAVSYGMTGPSLRATGVEYDLRSGGRTPATRTTISRSHGDRGRRVRRYLVRLEEMRQSARILDQALRSLPDGPFHIDTRRSSSRRRRRS